MYERYKLCPNLSPKEKCFRVQKYREGSVIETFHEHVPSHRISSSSEGEVLRALIGQVAGWNEMYILHSRLNSRRGGPLRHPAFVYHTTYPQEGVLRQYVRAGDATAWVDTVIDLPAFLRLKDSQNAGNL